MKVVEYTDRKQFWEDLCVPLLGDPSKNGLILGLCKMFLSTPEKCVYEAAAIKEGAFVGALICSKHHSNYNLVSSSLASAEEAELLLSDFLSKGHFFSGLIAESKTIDFYRECFLNRNIETTDLMRQGVYCCSVVNMPQPEDEFEFILASTSDLKLLGGWVEDFQEEAVPHDPRLDGVVFVEKLIKEKKIYVLKVGGEVVSMANFGRDIGASCTVSLVYTPKEKRGNGYASLMVAALTQRLLDSGKKEISLYTDLANPTSNKIYQNIGYELVCHSTHIGINGPKTT